MFCLFFLVFALCSAYFLISLVLLFTYLLINLTSLFTHVPALIVRFSEFLLFFILPQPIDKDCRNNHNTNGNLLPEWIYLKKI